MRDLVYCQRCLQNKPPEKTFAKFGKMRIQARSDRHLRYYRCRARELGYSCEQRAVQVEVIDAQVIALLTEFGAAASGDGSLTATVQAIVEERQEAARFAEIKAIVSRMDARWDHGFITDEQLFLEQRLTLQRELEQLEPLQKSDVPPATELLTNFAEHWEHLEGQAEEQRALIRLLVDRVDVRGDSVAAVILKGNHRLSLPQDVKGPAD